MPQLTLKHCTIADVELDAEQEEKRVIKINVNEEDFFEMLDHVNPKDIIKYLDTRKIPHRDALEVNVKPIEVATLPDRHSKEYGPAIRRLHSLENNNQRKLERLLNLVPEYHK